MYGTYRFKDKDPVIDIVRTCIDIYATLHGMKFTTALKALSKSSGVTVSCMNNWFYGTTCCPRYATIVAVVHATGREVSVHEGRSRARFKVIKGGRAA